MGELESERQQQLMAVEEVCVLACVCVCVCVCTAARAHVDHLMGELKLDFHLK